MSFDERYSTARHLNGIKKSLVPHSCKFWSDHIFAQRCCYDGYALYTAFIYTTILVAAAHKSAKRPSVRESSGVDTRFILLDVLMRLGP